MPHKQAPKGLAANHRRKGRPGKKRGQMKRLCAALVLATGFAEGNALAAHAAMDPYAIFSNARNVWAREHYPEYLTYVVTVRVDEGGVEKTRHYHLAFDGPRAKIYVNPVSDEERAAPPDPNGMTFHLIPRRQFMPLFDKKVGHPDEAVDYLGIPMIAPTYSFGMSSETFEGNADPNALVEEIRREFKDPTPPMTARELVTSGGIKTIVSVTEYKRRYDVTLSGVEDVDGHPCYHLVLRPIHPLPNLRLRDLWIDTQTYRTRQLRSAGNFTGSGVPWLVRFADVDGAMYISSEAALDPIAVGRHHYRQASVSFESIAPSARPPSTMGWFITKEAIMAEPGPQ